LSTYKQICNEENKQATYIWRVRPLQEEPQPGPSGRTKRRQYSCRKWQLHLCLCPWRPCSGTRWEVQGSDVDDPGSVCVCVLVFSKKNLKSKQE
jgi:hypothetical protein